MLELGRCDILLDVGLQRDYLTPAAPRCCSNAADVVRNTRRLMALARLARMRVLSCVDIRRPNELDHELRLVDPALTPAQRKSRYALLPDHVVIESDNCLCVPLDLLKAHQQTIFTKHHRDPFTNPKLDRLLTEMPASRFIVCGAGVEGTLRILVLGLLRRNRAVTLIEDACGHWSPDEASMVLRQLAVKGALVVSTQAFVSGELARMKSAARRPRVRGRRSVA